MNIQKESTVSLTKLYIFTALAMGLSLQAQARFIVEPHIDNISGKFSVVSGGEGSMSGTSTGLRIGYLGQAISQSESTYDLYNFLTKRFPDLKEILLNEARYARTISFTYIKSSF